MTSDPPLIYFKSISNAELQQMIEEKEERENTGLLPLPIHNSTERKGTKPAISKKRKLDEDGILMVDSVDVNLDDADIIVID